MSIYDGNGVKRFPVLIHNGQVINLAGVYYSSGTTIEPVWIKPVVDGGGSGADQVTLYPSLVEVTGAGTDWNDTQNAIGDSLGTIAKCNMNSSATSKELRLTGLSAGVPGNVTITGIQVTLDIAPDYTGDDAQGEKVMLLVAGNIVGINKTSNTQTLATGNKGNITASSFGGDSDLWGSVLTPAIVNAADFGVLIQLKAVTGYGWTQFQRCTVVVHYAV